MNLDKYFKKTIKAEIKLAKKEYEVIHKLIKQGFDFNEFISESIKDEIKTLCEAYEENNNNPHDGENNE